MGYKGRDVEVAVIDDEKYMVMACDSCGAVGLKEYDIVKVDPCTVGRLTLRVTLMEVISTGAKPVMISAAIANELSPTGEGIIEGIREELKSIGIDSLPVAISTEKNFETRQTGLGITVVGICDRYKLRVATSLSGDRVYCAGMPKVGNEISGAEDPEIAQVKHIIKLLSVTGVHDIIPVGSKGIMAEAGILAQNMDCSFKQNTDVCINVGKSAGPSTCFIFTCVPGCEVLYKDNVSVVEIGSLI